MAVSDIAYIAFNHPDMDAAERFYTDFGLSVAYRQDGEIGFRSASADGYCYIARQAPEAGLIAIGLICDDMASLESAARFPEASAVESITRPGGGLRVGLSSPDGIPFELTFGIPGLAPRTVRPALTFNDGSSKPRLGEWQRPEFEPATVLRLGHVALLTSNFKENAAWLGSRLGLKPSDVLYDGSVDNQIGGFFHCASGQGWVDHHTIALFPAEKPAVHHYSFEIVDMDAQFMGNKWMQSRGWKPLWGVGRHILGSQVFDYWYDPNGNIAEHFTDGDLVQAGVETGYHQVSDDALALWGPPISVSDFIGPMGKVSSQPVQR